MTNFSTHTLMQKEAIWHATWQATKESAPTFWPWILGYSVITTLYSYFEAILEGANLSGQLKENSQLLLQHPELSKQASPEKIHGMLAQLPWSLGMLLIASIAGYFFTVKYLRLAMGKNYAPNYSGRSYFNWLVKILCMYIRPSLWILLPMTGLLAVSKHYILWILWVIPFFIGLLFYYRSLIRYQLVSPLAVLQRGSELKTSWILTEGNCWRIIGNAFLVLLPFMVVGLCMLIPVYAKIFSHNHETSSSFLPNSNIMEAVGMVKNLMNAIMTAVFAIFNCTCYRILSQEAPCVEEPPPATNIPAT